MNRMEIYLIVFIVLVLLVVAYGWVRKEAQAPTNEVSISDIDNDEEKDENRVNQVCINGNCFEVEVAKTGKDRALGLMNREQLDQDKGMLFIFDNSAMHSFWMKNTKIALDIIWINANKEVVFISHDTQPCQQLVCPTYRPDQVALYVLEINGGLASAMGAAIGDKVTFKLNE